jgi:hypothetical protein
VDVHFVLIHVVFRTIRLRKEALFTIPKPVPNPTLRAMAKMAEDMARMNLEIERLKKP